MFDVRKTMKDCLETRGYSPTEDHLDELTDIYIDCQEWDGDEMLTGRTYDEVEDFVRHSTAVDEVIRNVRFLQPGDEKSVKALLKKKSENDDFLFGWNNEEIVETVQDGTNYWVGIFDNRALVGMCSLGEDDEAYSPEAGKTILLSDVYILPEKRGCGYGLEMVREAVSLAGSANRIELDILDDRLAGFYQKAGFELIGDGRMERRTI